MTARVKTATIQGVEAMPVEVECDLSRGLPGVIMVGLATKTVEEARERIRGAINNSRLTLPPRRVTLNLAPASVSKTGAGFDLPMALAILAASDQIPAGALDRFLAVGELALDGRLRPVKGIIAFAELAAARGLDLLLPRTNLVQAGLVKNARLFGCDNLRQAYEFVIGLTDLSPAKRPPNVVSKSAASEYPDLAEIHGQASAKRALEIAAAGHHNLLIDGPPGVGKSMLAHALVGLLPPLEPAELVEVAKLQTLVSAKARPQGRPFRTPHHSASLPALIGGQSPGEISLAHKGVLVLDELPEFPRHLTESLRQPLEEQAITITRAHGTVRYPADFMLVATKNPCPCGYFGDERQICRCAPSQIERYRKKLSGPLLDRIDMVVPVGRIDSSNLLTRGDCEPTAKLARRVAAARRWQRQRYRGEPFQVNARLPNRLLKQHLRLQPAGKELLDVASNQLGLSARGYVRTCKVARTIADLAGFDSITVDHVAEALQYRLATGSPVDP